VGRRWEGEGNGGRGERGRGGGANVRGGEAGESWGSGREERHVERGGGRLEVRSEENRQ